MLVTVNTLAAPFTLVVTLPLAAATTLLVPFTIDELLLVVEPAKDVLPPCGLVIVTDVALALIVAAPKRIELPDNQISLKRCVVLPKSYVSSVAELNYLP